MVHDDIPCPIASAVDDVPSAQSRNLDVGCVSQHAIKSSVKLPTAIRSSGSKDYSSSMFSSYNVQLLHFYELINYQLLFVGI
ncbi:hypothetical protein TNCV_3491901 [Trichonephila clavipes]|nr:hypothetical protein TNCV_3491901 [Trichonephila clavipes]